MPSSASLICACADSDRGRVRRGSRHRRVVLLLRNLVLRQQWFQPLDVLRRLRRIRRSLTLPRLRRHQPRASHFDALLRLEVRGLRPFDAAACRHLVARGRRRCNRNADARPSGGRFGIGKLGTRALERDLVVALVDLDEHGARLDLLIRFDGHTQHSPADTRRDRRDMRIHLRIVGRLAPRGDPPPDSRRQQRGERQLPTRIRTRLLIWLPSLRGTWPPPLRPFRGIARAWLSPR